MNWLSPSMVEMRVDLNARDDNNWVRVPAAVLVGLVYVDDEVLVTDEDGDIIGKGIVQMIDGETGVGFVAVDWDGMRRRTPETTVGQTITSSLGTMLRRVVTIPAEQRWAEIIFLAGAHTSTVGIGEGGSVVMGGFDRRAPQAEMTFVLGATG